MAEFSDKELTTVYRTWHGRGDVDPADLADAHVKLYGRDRTALALCEAELTEVRRVAVNLRALDSE